jgi:hypothetical protein
VGSHVIGRKLNLRRDFTALAPNSQGERSWQLKDSLNTVIARVTTTPGSVTVKGTSGSVTEPVKPHHLELQGRGAMVTDALEDDHALVAINMGDLRFRVRGFLPRRALPEKNHRGQAIRSVVDAADTGNGGSKLSTVAEPIIDQEFKWWEEFEGSDGIERSYTTYAARPACGNAIYFMVNTTGVRGGGIVRGVTRAGREVQFADHTSPLDPNSQVRVFWRYVRIGDSRMWGWLPVRG